MSNYNLDPLNTEAIESAVSGAWDKAVDLNLELTKKYPDEAEIYNRLAKAYIEVANLEKAKSAYKAALKIDPYNHIAKKNLEKVNTINPKDLQRSGGAIVSPDLFLEEPGKTRLTYLEDVAMGTVVSTLKIGDRLTADVTNNTVILLTSQGKRIGKIEDDTALIVTQALRKGCKFDYIVKSVDFTQEAISPAIFIKETLHSLKLNAPVFAAKREEVSTLETTEQDELADDKSHESDEHRASETPIGEVAIDEMIVENPSNSNTSGHYDEENDDVVTELPDMDEETPAELVGEKFDEHDEANEENDDAHNPKAEGK